MRRAQLHWALALLCLAALWPRLGGAAPRHMHLGGDTGCQTRPSQAELLSLLEGLAHAEEKVCRLAVDALLCGCFLNRGPPDEAGPASRAPWDGAPASEAVPLLASRLGAAQPCVRRLAATWLGRSEGPRALAVLRAALASPRAEERQAAALGLGERADASLRAPLEAALLDRDAGVAATAAWALGALQDARAIAALKVAAHHAQARVRQAAVASLGSFSGGDTLVLAVLLEGLKDKDADVRREAAEALGR
ncbi:MAG: HEAT repeat domain-containing protein [Myxococcaceae bacterium]